MYSTLYKTEAHREESISTHTPSTVILICFVHITELLYLVFQGGFQIRDPDPDPSTLVWLAWTLCNRVPGSTRKGGLKYGLCILWYGLRWVWKLLYQNMYVDFYQNVKISLLFFFVFIGRIKQTTCRPPHTESECVDTQVYLDTEHY